MAAAVDVVENGEESEAAEVEVAENGGDVAATESEAAEAEAPVEETAAAEPAAEGEDEEKEASPANPPEAVNGGGDIENGVATAADGEGMLQTELLKSNVNKFCGLICILRDKGSVSIFQKRELSPCWKLFHLVLGVLWIVNF